MTIETVLSLVAQTTDAAWSFDFANAAWGAIVAAAVSAIVGGLLKAAADRNLATAQGQITKNVQEYVIERQTSAQKALQTELQAEHALLQQRLAELQARLDDASNAASARREYEYEARKRLYAEVEPLFFQIYEGLEEAHYRVLSLARTDRAGNLSGREGWLDKKGYYLSSTAYKLLLPAAHLRLLQRRMTFVDFGLDPQIDLRYLLLKLYVRSFTDDFVFAEKAGLAYQPNHRDWATLRQTDPAQYARQALVVGALENVADLLIVEDNGKQRAMSIGEFDGLLSANPMAPSITEALSLFQAFSSEQKPVLACILVAQVYLARFILSTYHQGVGTAKLEDLLVERVIDDEELKANLLWAGGSTDALVAAKSYLVERLKKLGQELATRSSSRAQASAGLAQLNKPV